MKLNWKNISATCTTFSALTLALISTTPAQAGDYDIGSIHITQPWARATPKGASSGAAYMTITNNGKTPDRVSCVSSDVSARMSNSHHDHGQRRDEDATRTGRPRNQAGGNRHA